MTGGESTGRSGSTRIRGERGALAIEMVLLLPLAFTLLFLVLQGAVYYQGRTVALSAAQDGARGAAGYEADDGDGQAAASRFVQKAGGGGLLNDPDISVHRDPDGGTVTVTVSGTTGSFIPGWDPHVSQSASRSIEEFTAPEDANNAVPDRRPPGW